MLEQVGCNPQTLALTDSKGVQRMLVGEKIITDAGVNLFDVIVPAGGLFAATLLWAVLASDGTDHQSFTGQTAITAVNKGGTFTENVVTLAGVQAKAVSAGTLTISVTIVDGTSKITIVFTPTGSLTETVYRLAYTLFNHSRHPVIAL